MEDYRHILLSMGYGDVCGVVLKVGLTVVVVAQVYLFIEQGVEEGPHSKALLAEGFALYERDFFHLVGGGGGKFYQLILGFCDLPHAYCGFVFKFLL